MGTEVMPGRSYFYCKAAINGYSDGTRFDDFLYTAVTAPEQGGCTIRNGKGEEKATTTDLLSLNGLNKKAKNRIYRLCRAIGYLRANLPNGSELKMPSVADILGFRKGEGQIVAFLAEKRHGNLRLRVREYVDGTTDTLDKVYDPKRAAVRKARGKIAVKLPSLETLDQARDFAAGIYDRARTLIVGQDDAAKLFVVRTISYLQTGVSTPLLITGPTGVGKTYTVRTVAELMGIPFARAVVPDFTPTGFKGANVQDILAREIRDIAHRYDKPTRMIVQLDEFDKVVRKDPEFAAMLQNELLKVLEPGGSLTIDVHYGDIERVDMQAMLVLSGAFSFIKYDPAEGMSEAMLREAGFVDELIGRMGTPLLLRALGKTDFVTMLTADPPLPVVTQSTADLRSFGISVALEPDAVQFLAEAAVKSKMGARRLASDFRTVTDQLRERLLFGGVSERIDGVSVEDLAEGKRVFRIKGEFVRKNIKGPPTNRAGIGFRT